MVVQCRKGTNRIIAEPYRLKSIEQGKRNFSVGCIVSLQPHHSRHPARLNLVLTYGLVSFLLPRCPSTPDTINLHPMRVSTDKNSVYYTVYTSRSTFLIPRYTLQYALMFSSRLNELFPRLGLSTCMSFGLLSYLPMHHCFHRAFFLATTSASLLSSRFTPPVLSTCPLHTNSGCGKERRILIGPW